MNILGVGANCFAFAGRTTVYVRALPKPASDDGAGTDTCSSGNGICLDPPSEITFPSEWIAKNGHLECIAISNDSRFVAVADSIHGLYLFRLELDGKPNWLQIMCTTSNKRVIKLQFTSDGQFLTFLDKQGDIYAVLLREDHSKTANIKKILGHTSFISDYATRVESKQIVSCDRDEKIRISNFPDAFVIQGFKLGHTESVISVAILRAQTGDEIGTLHTYLLSISLTGVVLLWDFDKPIDGAETDVLKKWNIKEYLPEDTKEAGVKVMKAGVKVMKAVSLQDKVYFSVALTGSTKIYIFQVAMASFQINLLRELEMESENVVMEWSPPSNNICNLILYTPDLGSIKCWHSGDDSLRCNLFELSESVIADMKASIECLKLPVVPMKKRSTTFEDATAQLQEQNSKKAKTG